MKLNLLIIILIPFLKLFSSSVGNTAGPSIIEEGFFISDKAWLNFRLGYENYTVEDLDLKFEDSFQEQDFKVQKIKAFANIGTFTFNVKERLDAFIHLGSMKIEPYIQKFQTTLFKAKSNSGFLFRVGSKLVVFEILDFTLGIDGRFSIFKSTNEYLTQNDVLLNNDKFKYIYNEWQIAVGVTQKISILRPYGGIVYRGSELRLINTPFFQNKNMNLTFDKKHGIVIGTSASMGSFVMINAELRLVNERSITISGDIRF
jgi:hypothetical protein